MRKMETYKVLVGDPFGGYATVQSGLTYEDARILQDDLEGDVDYFTSVLIKSDRE